MSIRRKYGFSWGWGICLGGGFLEVSTRTVSPAHHTCVCDREGLGTCLFLFLLDGYSCFRVGFGKCLLDIIPGLSFESEGFSVCEEGLGTCLIRTCTVSPSNHSFKTSNSFSEFHGHLRERIPGLVWNLGSLVSLLRGFLFLCSSLVRQGGV